MRRVFVLSGLLLFIVSFAAAQSSSYGDRGAYEVFGFGASHDSSLGWTSELDTGVGYDFNRKFNMQFGVPLYLVSSTAKAAATTTTDHYSSLGDVSLGLSLHPRFSSFTLMTG